MVIRNPALRKVVVILGRHHQPHISLLEQRKIHTASQPSTLLHPHNLNTASSQLLTHNRRTNLTISLMVHQRISHHQDNLNMVVNHLTLRPMANNHNIKTLIVAHHHSTVNNTVGLNSTDNITKVHHSLNMALLLLLATSLSHITEHTIIRIPEVSMVVLQAEVLLSMVHLNIHHSREGNMAGSSKAEDGKEYMIMNGGKLILLWGFYVLSGFFFRWTYPASS